MLRSSATLLKKGWTHNPGRTRRGAKNLAWRPKISPRKLNQFVPLNMEHPRRRPNSWQPLEFTRLGFSQWPKEIGFFNAGDNFELTPEMMWRLFDKNKGEAFWKPQHNEKTIIHLMPKVELEPKTYLPRVHEVFSHHVQRFGADHMIYNATMQAYAFAHDLEGCKKLLNEMKTLSLVPNGQTYVNMMLACRLCGQPQAAAEEYFKEAVATDALTAVVRLDTEFKMWWDQLERLGSFSSKTGFLSNKEEGAKPVPRNMWALWGWEKGERKFVHRRARIAAAAEDVLGVAAAKQNLMGTVYQQVRRQPWAKYRGLLPYDWKGPMLSRAAKRSLFTQPFSDAPPATLNSTPCAPAY